MKIKEIKDKKDQELAKLLVQKRQELRANRFSTAGSKPRDVNLARKLRRDIAQILTEINYRKDQ